VALHSLLTTFDWSFSPWVFTSSLSPAMAGVLLAGPFSGLPLVLCGALKIVYDVALLFSFRHTKPPEERGGQ